MQINWNWLRTNGRRLLLIVAMIPVFLAVQIAAYWLRFDAEFDAAEWELLSRTSCWIVAVKLWTFMHFGVLRGWLRCVTFHDLIVLTKATTIAALLIALADFLLFPETNVPRSVFLLDWSGTILTVGLLRSWKRLLLERRGWAIATAGRLPVLIVGANDSGEALARTIRRNPHLGYGVVGFVTDDRRSLHTSLDGIPVLGELADTCRLARKHSIAEVLITAGDLPGHRVRMLIEQARGQGVLVKVVPSHTQLLQGDVDLRPRTVSIEDLLRREPVRLDLDDLHFWLDGKTIMVTGSAGSIGSEICRQLLRFDLKRIVLVDRFENGQFFLERELRALRVDIECDVCIADVGDAARMASLIRLHRPDVIFHAAAYKHVPLMESNPGEAVKNTILATRVMADLAHQNGVGSFVMISTDKAVNPTSVMGGCKRVAELYVQSLAAHSRCRFVTVRFGNVLDSAGSVVPIFREQIERGGPVTVTHPDMVRYFMTIPEASQLVIQAGAMGMGGEIFVLNMGEPVKIVDLAKDMIRLSGLELGRDINIEFVGTRPGEKLFEELLVHGEKHLPTTHSKIMVAEGESVQLRLIREAIDRLSELSNGSNASILNALGEVVPFCLDSGRTLSVHQRAA